MTTEIKVKEYDLHAIIKDLVNSALEIDRPNKEKICKFIVNLVENGGHKTNAALQAGYGPKKSKDGRNLSLVERKNIASVEGTRLLTNDSISKLYEKLLSHRFTATIFTKSFSKEHMISVLYQIGMNTYEENPRQAIMAFKEAATLAGHYDEDKKDDDPNLVEKLNELISGAEVRKNWEDSQKDKIEEPVRVKSEVYN